jgi:hypothetical protein
MRQALAPTRRLLDLRGHEVVFDPDHARRALPYVARVARDAVAAYRNILHCRAALKSRLTPRERLMVDDRRDEALHQLNSAIDECNAVGADLLDIQRGLVRFNAHINGRP